MVVYYHVHDMIARFYTLPSVWIKRDLKFELKGGFAKCYELKDLATGEVCAEE